MVCAGIDRGVAVVLLVIFSAGMTAAASQPPKGPAWIQDAIRAPAPVPGPTRDALFIARSIDGPDRPRAALAPLPTLTRARQPLPGRGVREREAVEGPKRRHGDRRGRSEGREMIEPPVPPAAVSAVPIPPAAPLLFAALGGLALLGRRARAKDRERGASEA